MERQAGGGRRDLRGLVRQTPLPRTPPSASIAEMLHFTSLGSALGAWARSKAQINIAPPVIARGHNTSIEPCMRLSKSPADLGGEAFIETSETNQINRMVYMAVKHTDSTSRAVYGPLIDVI